MTISFNPEQFDVSKHFSLQSLARKRIVNAIVPTFNYGPSFIGSSFGLNVIDMGADIYISDLLGQDALILKGNVGKNIKEDVPLNNDVDIYYQRRLVPLTSSTYTHSPTLYARAARSEIHNLIGRYKGEADTSYYADMADLGYANVLHDLDQEISIDDVYRHEFRFYNMGIHIPVAPRHTILLDAGYRQYYETLKRNQTVNDYSTFLVNGTDITDEVAGAPRYVYLYLQLFQRSRIFQQ